MQHWHIIGARLSRLEFIIGALSTHHRRNNRIIIEDILTYNPVNQMMLNPLLNVFRKPQLYWNHKKGCDFKSKIYSLTDMCLWIRALNANWLTVTSAHYVSLTCAQIVFKELICCVTIFKTIFKEQVDWRQIARKRHIATPSTSQIWNPLEMIPM